GDTRVTCTVGLRRRALCAVQAFRQDAGHRGLACAARTGEEIGLAHLVGGDRVLQRPDDRLLADHLVEALGTVLPVEGGHRTIQAGTGDRRTRPPTASAASTRRTSRSAHFVWSTTRIVANARPGSPFARRPGRGRASRTEGSRGSRGRRRRG